MLASVQRAVSSSCHSARRVLSYNAKGVGFGRLDGKVIINCGAGNPPEEGHGIGASTSIACARLGAKVISVSNEQLNADTVTAAIEAEGNEGAAYCADVRQASAVADLYKFALEKYGRIDGVINSGVHNAANNGFAKITEESWKDAIDTNLHAHFQLVHQVLPIFEEQGGGNILHFTTIAGSVGLGIGKQRHPYAAGKAAAAVLTKRVGAEYAPKNIRANVVEIGYCSGPLVNRAVKAGNADIDAVTAQRDSYVPRGKQGTPEEIANVAVFLLSEEASFINASSIFVDGGGSGCTLGP